MARCTRDANDRWLGEFLVQGQPGPAAIENKKKREQVDEYHGRGVAQESTVM